MVLKTCKCYKQLVSIRDLYLPVLHQLSYFLTFAGEHQRACVCLFLCCVQHLRFISVVCCAGKVQRAKSKVASCSWKYILLVACTTMAACVKLCHSIHLPMLCTFYSTVHLVITFAKQRFASWNTSPLDSAMLPGSRDSYLASHNNSAQAGADSERGKGKAVS